MECFTVLRYDAWERYAQALRLGNTLHCTCNLSLDNARLTHLHSGGVHCITNLESSLQSLNLLGRLNLTHLDYGKHQIYRFVVVELRYRYTQEARELNFALTSIWWKDVDTAILLHRSSNNSIERLQRLAVRHAHLRTKFHKARLRTCPDNILNGEIVAKEHRLARLGIHHRHQRRNVKTEVVEESRILTERISIVRVVEWRE